MPELFELLSERAGHYAGEGMNHEGETFRGKLNLAEMVEGGFVLRFIATGLDGAVHHREESRLLAGPDGGMVFIAESSNHDGAVEHRFRREEAADHSFRAFVFGHGEIHDRGSFRQEIALDIWSDGDIGYRYSWGMPGGEFASRSGVRMRRIA